MWCVYGQCLVYGEDYLCSFNTKKEAEDYYNERIKGEEYYLGYVRLFLFKPLKVDALRIGKDAYDNREYDFLDGEMVRTSRKKVKFIDNEHRQLAGEIVINENGFKKGDVGVIDYSSGGEDYFSISNATQGKCVHIDKNCYKGNHKRFIEITDEEYWSIRESQDEYIKDKK